MYLKTKEKRAAPAAEMTSQPFSVYPGNQRVEEDSKFIFSSRGSQLAAKNNIDDWLWFVERFLTSLNPYKRNS